MKGEKKLQKYFQYLDDLRESGVTNMFGAASFLQKEFPLEFLLDHKLAKDVLILWMETFDETVSPHDRVKNLIIKNSVPKSMVDRLGTEVQP